MMQFLVVQQNRRGASVFSSSVSFHTPFSFPPVSRAVIQHVDIWSFFLALSCRFSALRDVKTASSAVAEGTSLLS